MLQPVCTYLFVKRRQFHLRSFMLNDNAAGFRIVFANVLKLLIAF